MRLENVVALTSSLLAVRWLAELVTGKKELDLASAGLVGRRWYNGGRVRWRTRPSCDGKIGLRPVSCWRGSVGSRQEFVEPQRRSMDLATPLWDAVVVLVTGNLRTEFGQSCRGYGLNELRWWPWYLSGTAVKPIVAS